ncbi:MAG: hypothetical protein RLZZ214_2990 [Verrucomicrobiota bacterium]
MTTLSIDRAVNMAMLFCFWLGLAGGASASIAMAPFESGDDSYQSAEAAEDFAALLQVALAEKRTGTWVERAEIQKVRQELELQAFGMQDATHGLRLGTLLKANLLVTGNFVLDQDRGRSLEVEIIDVQHADVLAGTSLRIHGVPGQPLVVDPADVAAAAEKTASALARATQALAAAEGRKRIMPVFFRDVSPDSERSTFLEKEIHAAFARTTDARFRMLTLPRAGASAGESELILAGLVAHDPELWQRLAEVYVWGEYAEFESADVAFEEVQVRLTLHVCAGGREIATVEETFPLKNRDSALAEAVRKSLAAASTPAMELPAPAARAGLAASLLARARDARTRFPDLSDAMKQTPSGQRRWRYRVGLLEMAYFLDPGNEELHRELMIERWNRGAFYPVTRRDWTGRHFRGLCRQSDAWLEFVRRHGISSLDRIPHDPVTLSKLPFVSSPLGQEKLPHQNFYLDLPAAVGGFISKRDRAFPTDVPDAVRLKWLNEVARDFQRRLKAVAEECPEKFALQLFPLGQRVLWFPDARMRADTFGLLWQLGRDEKIDAAEIENFQKLLRDAYRLAGREQEAQRILSGDKGPLIDDSAKPTRDTAQFWKDTANHLEKIARPHPLAAGEIESRFRAVSLTNAMTIESAPLVFHAADRFWVVARQRNPAASVLWQCDEQGGNPVAMNAVQVPGRQKFTCGLVHEGKLWLGADGAGVWRIDTKSRAVTTFDHAAGLPTEEIHSCAVDGNEIYFGGGTPQAARLGAFDTQRETWRMIGLGEGPGPGRASMLAAQRQRIFSAGRPPRTPHEWDSHSRRWTDLGTVIPADAAPNHCMGDDSGIWLASQGKLAHLDLETRTYLPLFEFPDRIHALLGDGDFLWLATANTAPDAGSRIVKCNTRIHLIHKASRKLIGYRGLPFNAPIDSMAASGTKLWLGLRSGFGDKTYLAEMDTSGLLAKWTGKAE